MASEVRIGKLRYDIVSDTTKFERGIRASRAEIKQADRAFRDHAKASTKTRQELERLAEVERKAGASGGAIARQRSILSARLREELNIERQLETAKKAAGITGQKEAQMLAKEADSVKKLNNELKKLNGEKKKGAMFNAKHGAIGGTLGGNILSVMGGGGAGAAAGRLGGTGAGMFGVHGIIAGAAGATVGGIVTKGLMEFGRLEMQMADLGAMIGDPSKAESLISNLRKLARETPLTTQSLMDATKILISYGVDASADMMRRLGDVAGGNAERLRNLATAFAQVQATGRLMGQEMLQLTNAGFGRKLIADSMGIAMEDFRRLMEEGKISALDVKLALIDATSAGGMFEGRMEEMSKTLVGSWDRMWASINEGFADIGEQLAGDGAIASGLREIGDLAKENLQRFADGLAVVKHGLDQIASVQGDVNVRLQELGLPEWMTVDYWETLKFAIMSSNPFTLMLQGAFSYHNMNEEDPFESALPGLFPDPDSDEAKELAKQQAVAEAARTSLKKYLEEIEKLSDAGIKLNSTEEEFRRYKINKQYEQDVKDGMTAEHANRLRNERLLLLDEELRKEQEISEEKARQKAFDDQMNEATRMAIQEEVEARKDQLKDDLAAAKAAADAKKKDIELGKKAVITAGGEGGSKAGSDYAFMAKRQMKSEQYKLDQERNKKLDAIADALKDEQDRLRDEAELDIEIIQIGQ